MSDYRERDEQEPVAWGVSATPDGAPDLVYTVYAYAKHRADAEGAYVVPLYQHPPAPAAVPLEAIQYAYNSGYNAGHLDTVEGNATPLTHQELTRERDEAASEVMDELESQGLLQSAEPARIETKTNADDMEYMPEGAVDFWGESASREMVPKASGVSRVYDGDRPIDGLVMVSFSRPITDDELRALHDFLGSEPASRSESESQAEVLDRVANTARAYSSSTQLTGAAAYNNIAEHCEAEAARLRGEGEES